MKRRKTKRVLLCHSNGRVYRVGNRRDLASNDILLVKTHDQELVILTLNILLRSRQISSISDDRAKQALAFIVNGPGNGDEE